MSFTDTELQQMHPVYWDIMTALKIVVDSRSRPFQLRGLPAGKLYDLSARKYGYNPEQFYEIADNLLRHDLVTKDDFGVFAPTVKGEAMIRRLIPEPTILTNAVPALDLSE